ncbi:SGNH/GDSL hydrolase family protein [Streptomyces sp. SM11]|uniref:SGNH/GDSL hydrolase family protein n=1 Tax=Streptomyces sp. SM11 TaxID=565557 RepID=UPI000CD5867B|nr:SGNH/GDSL hydrolase family protein [Streptomyces sp. SM11]
MPRRQGYALLIALMAGTAVLATALAFGTTLLSGPRSAPLPPAETQAAARNPVDPAASGGRVISDPVVVPVAPDSDLQVSFRTPQAGGPVTYHPRTHQTSYLIDERGTWSTTHWRYLTAVDVRSEQALGAVVAFGDSLTAGSGSTTDANARWPDVLADRLGGRYGVANAGISGNRVAGIGRGTGGPSGTDRLDRDALSVAGARTVVVALGINDLQQSPQETDPQRIVDGLRALTDRAHARGLTVVGATLTPFEGFRTWTPERDAVRHAVNEQIRAGTVFDTYVDFDAAVRDPAAPNRILAPYDSGDHLHLNDDGYRALGDRLDLTSLDRARTPRSDAL